MRDDRIVRVGNPVTNLKVDHQLEQFVFHSSVLIFVPNSAEICLGKAPFSINDFDVIQDLVDGSGPPLGLQDDYLSEYRVILEVETNTQVM